jgi:hypothetical protein
MASMLPRDHTVALPGGRSGAKNPRRGIAVPGAGRLFIVWRTFWKNNEPRNAAPAPVRRLGL